MEETNVTQTPELTEQELSELLQIRRDKLSALQSAGKDPFAVITYPQTHHSAEIIANYDALEGKDVSIAGRMMSKRIMGKASFAHLLDGAGDIQFYVRREDVGDEAYADFKAYDIGDILGVKGFVFKTRTGEISVHATELTL
ncbi:MAG: lysine--tRNA ligase, partial [Clostridia bacterium]|nr:lysine--tRNA ligase [Clostridia bacterium]